MDEAVMSLFADLGLRADKFARGIDSSKTDLSDFKDDIMKVTDFALASFTAIGAGAIGAGVAIGKAGWDAYNEYSDALASLTATTGEVGTSLYELGDISREIWREGIGEDLNEVANAVSLVKNQIEGLGADQLDDVSAGVLMLRDTFNVDLREGVDAVDQLMNQMGLSATDALDFIVSGYQRGLNANNDFIDSIREYSNQFNSAGFSASEFFSIMETGVAGGVLGTDKVSDAIKELQIRFDAGDKTIKTGLESMGYSWDTFHQQVLSGQMDMSDLFPILVTRLNEMKASGEDYKSTMFNIFGTQSQDLQQLMLSLNAGKTSVDDLAGSADVLREKYNTLPALWEQIGRQFQDSMIPLGGMLASAVEDAMPMVESAFTVFRDEIIPFLLEAGEEFSTAWSDASATFTDAFNRIDEALGGTMSETDWLKVTLDALRMMLDAVVVSIELAASAMNTIASGVEWVTGKVHPLVNAWEDLRIKLEQVQGAFPEYLIPHSPPPFAKGLDDIRSSLSSMNREFAMSPIDMSVGGGMSGGSSTTNYVTNNDNRQTSLNVNRYGGQEVGVSDMQTLLSLV